MTNKTLNRCMRVSMEGLPLVDFDFDKSIDAWSQLKNRRIIFQLESHMYCIIIVVDSPAHLTYSLLKTILIIVTVINIIIFTVISKIQG